MEGMPQYLSTRHEEVAVGMASGYAKSTGKLPAVMIHTTVGSLHATMGMRGAVREQVPMVVFSWRVDRLWRRRRARSRGPMAGATSLISAVPRSWSSQR